MMRPSFPHIPQWLCNTLLVPSLFFCGQAATLAGSVPEAAVVEVVSVFEEPSHHIILANDRLSVYRVDIQATEDSRTLYHYHENDQLTVLTLDSSGFDQRLGGMAERFQAPAGTLLFTSYSAEKAVPHQILVPAGEQFGVIGIEFSGPPSPQLEKRYSAPTESDFEIPQAQVRRLQFEGDETLHPNSLMVSLGNYTLNVEEQGATTIWKAKRGDVHWVDARASASVISTVSPARLIVVTLKPR